MTDYFTNYLYQIPDSIDRIDILGGGASRQQYEDIGSFVISCHVPLERTDLLVSNHAEYFPPFTIPYIIKKNWYPRDPRISDKPKDTESLYSVENLVVWVRHGHVDNKKNYLEYSGLAKQSVSVGLNTGQTGYLWALSKNPKEIHLWGMDGYETWEAHNDYYQPHLDVAHKYFPWYGPNPSQKDLKNNTLRWKHLIKPNTIIHLKNNTIYV